MQPPRLNQVPNKKAKLNHNQKPLKMSQSELARVISVNNDLLREAPDIFARARIRADITVKRRS